MSIVTSAFGRPGPTIVAELGDYAASQVANDSAAPGATVAEASDGLAAEIATKVELAGDLGGTSGMPAVIKLQGLSIAAIAPNDNDRLTWVAANNRWEPKPPPPPITTLWSVLYERDLRALPTQAIGVSANAYAAFTMDGQPWYAHTASGSLSVVNGQGIIGSVSGDAGSGNPYAGINFGLRVSAMAGYDPTMQQACQVQWSGPLSDLGTKVVGASVWSGNEAWGYGPGNNSMIVKLNNGAVSFSLTGASTVFNSGFLTKPGGLEQQDTWSLGVSSFPIDGASRDGNRNYRCGYFRRDVSDMPEIEQLIGMGAWNGTGTAESTNAKMGFYAGAASGTYNFTAIRIRILQKAAP